MVGEEGPDLAGVAVLVLDIVLNAEVKGVVE